MSKEVIFKQSCLIRKNTPGLRGKLSDLGYKIAPHQYFEERKRGILCRPALAVGVPDDCTDFSLDEYLKNNPQIIDCGTNEALFLALADLRDDSDYMQYFIAAESDKPMLCTKENIEDHTVWHELYRKMTAEELVDYFNKQNV